MANAQPDESFLSELVRAANQKIGYIYIPKDDPIEIGQALPDDGCPPDAVDKDRIPWRVKIEKVEDGYKATMHELLR